MALKLEELPPSLRDRIKRQLADEDAATARARRVDQADDARLRPEVCAQPAPPLGRRAEGEAQGEPGRRPRYRVDWTLYSCQPLDWDNLAGSVKEAQDRLVELGWIPGDDWEVLEGSATTRKVGKRKEQRLEVVITRVS